MRSLGELDFVEQRIRLQRKNKLGGEGRSTQHEGKGALSNWGKGRGRERMLFPGLLAVMFEEGAYHLALYFGSSWASRDVFNIAPFLGAPHVLYP